MYELYYHEGLYRGEDALARIGQVRLVVCGAGAVGSNLVDNLVRQGFRHIRVVDYDRVEPHNAGTQTYAQGDAGAFKVDVLQAEVFRAVGIEIEPVRKRLTARNVARHLAGAGAVVDGFDNHDGRALVAAHCRSSGVPCLHVGLHTAYAEVRWNEGYRVPRDVIAGDPCDYALARNLVQFAVALASEALVRFVLEGRRQNHAFTLGDLRIHAE
jgi:molybdopterin/thiamine biosynthesis adenylyltransferase